MEFLPASLIKTIIQAAIAQYDLSADPDLAQVTFCYPKYNVHYTCSVAFALSQKSSKTALEIAELLHKTLSDRYSELTVTVGNLGVLNFCLTPIYLAECLEQLLENLESGDFLASPHDRNHSSDLQTFTGYTYVQYAYARCGSLLRLLERSQSPELLLLKPLITDQELALTLNILAIAEGLDSNLAQKTAIKAVQNLAAEFIRFSDRTSIISAKSEILLSHRLLIKISQRLILLLASDYIDLPECL